MNKKILKKYDHVIESRLKNMTENITNIESKYDLKAFVWSLEEKMKINELLKNTNQLIKDMQDYIKETTD